MIGQWYKYDGYLYQIVEDAGPFPHSPSQYLALVHDADVVAACENDPWGVLEIVMNGVRVDENGRILTTAYPSAMDYALAQACLDKWMWRVDEKTYATSLKRAEVASRLYRLKESVDGNPVPKRPAASLVKVLGRKGITILWQKKPRSQT